MGIKVDVLELQRKSTLAGSLAIQLNNKVSEINSIYYSLDSKVKSRESIEYSLRDLHQRMQKAQQRMDAMGRFLSVAANKYNNAESAVRARAAALGQVSVGSAVGVGAASGAATGNTESKNRDKSNWFKIAVGAVVVGTAIAAAIAFSATVAGPILIGAAVGATIGAGIGGVIGGVTSKKSGGNFIDGFADGFKWGAIGGAASGAVGVTGLGILGTAGAEGAINGAIYVGQTRENGGHITAAGIGTSFVVGAAFSAVGNVASKKISKVVGSKVKDIDKSEVKAKIKILNAKDVGLKAVNKWVTQAEKLSMNQIDDLIEDIGGSIKNHPLRQEYENAVKNLSNYEAELRGRSLNEKEIAQAMHQVRRDLGVKYKNLTPEALREYIYEVNIKRYDGDPLGGSFEFFENKYMGDYSKIIEGAKSPNGNVDKLLEGFKKWLIEKNK